MSRLTPSAPFARNVVLRGLTIALILGCEPATAPPVPVYSVMVTPASSQMTAGQTLKLSAELRDQNGSVLTGRTVTWDVDNSAIATVSPNGTVSAVAAGTVTISAISEGVMGNSYIDVRAAVASVLMAPATVNLNIGQTTTLTATPRDAAGNSLTGRTVTWTTSNAAAATVADGVVTGVAEGSATITAAVEGRTATAQVTVIRVPVAAVTLDPASGALNRGGTLQLTATARDAQGNALSNRTFTWTSSSEAVATVSSSGLVTGVAVGTTTISATSEGRTGTAAITVRLPVATVAVAPAAPGILTGQTVTLTATLRDAAGAVLTGRAVSWTSSAPSVAAVSQSGVVTGLTAGTATITATSEGQSGTATVTVTRPEVGSVTVAPATRTIVRGTSTSFTATVRDVAGNILTDRAVTWASSNNAVATVSATGGVTGVGDGTATITATSEGRSGNATVTVTPPPPPPPPTVTLNITNQLLAPINVSVNNGQATGSVPAGQTRSVTVAANSVSLSWNIVQTYGDPMAGVFDTRVNPPSQLSYIVNNIVGTQHYFAPVVTNTTSQDWLMGVNNGLQSQNRCNCIVRAGQTNVFLGYYRLFSNSNVRAYLASNGYSGEYWYWNVSSAPTGSGRVDLR